ncbi:MAG: adenosylmethionine--8-amino-7-oxononanoate transaminase [Thermodesulfobacteriota bacterium]
MNLNELYAVDRSHVLHPYTSMTDPLPVYAVERAEGVRLYLEDGRVLIDGMSSWWAAIHGYNHPVLNEAIRKQSEKMCHVMFGGITHRPAVELALALLAIAPGNLSKVFFCDSGSVSVEVAIKMALQYQHAAGRPSRRRLVTIRSGYHGDTFGAMAVCDPVTGMHHLFSSALARHFFCDAPPCPGCPEKDAAALGRMEEVFRENEDEIAALILEPVVQGAGGMRFYSPGFVAGAADICRRHGALFIADEIATGFGRTGHLFACDEAKAAPDILCIGKALTGGTMSMAATLTTDHVAQTISKGSPGLFMHGPTFMANPLACAVALASLRLLLSSPWKERVLRIEGELGRELSGLTSSPAVSEVRVKGAIGVVEMKQPVNMAALQALFVENGAWIRPFGKLVYLMPPFIIQTDELKVLTEAIKKAL